MERSNILEPTRREHPDFAALNPGYISDRSCLAAGSPWYRGTV